MGSTDDPGARHAPLRDDARCSRDRLRCVLALPARAALVAHAARALLPRGPRAARACAAIAIAACAAIVAGVREVHNLPLDDAYIHLSYGIDASLHTLFSFQGGHRDTGTSSWLWTLICILVVKLHLPVFGALTALSIAIFAGVLHQGMEVVARALPRDIPLRWLWPYASALLLAANGNVVWLSLTGMETGLSILLLLLAVPRLLSSGVTKAAALLSLLAIWTRIESVLWLGVAAALLPITAPRGGRRASRAYLLPLAGLAVYLAYNLLVSGHLLPTTALAKRASFIPSGHALKDIRDFILSLTRNYLRPWVPGWLVEIESASASAALLAVAGAHRAFRRKTKLDPPIAAAAALLIGALLHTLANLVGFRSAYHHLRYFAPELYLIPILAPLLIARAAHMSAAPLWAWIPRGRMRAAMRMAGPGLALIPLGLALSRDLRGFPDWVRLYRQNAEQLGAIHLAVGSYLRDARPDARRVASFDIGALRWASRLQVSDLGGVLDAVALGYLEARKPTDFVRDTHAELYVSVENGWDAIPRVQPTYELVPLRTFEVPEYLDPFPPHSKRMAVYRVNHCGEPRLVRQEVGDRLAFDFAPQNAAARGATGVAEGSSFGRWPVTARDLRHGAPLAEGSFLSSDASDLRDKATGRFHTVAMKAEGDWLSFRLAGGHDPDKLRIELRSEGRLVATFTGFDTDAFLEIVYPLADLRGKMFSLALIDEKKGGWGHLMLDEVKQFSWREAPPKPCPARR
ncbi:MAG: hypothetical protein U0359_19815 [Byssovorax sp.]